jgi:hypothetical protein
MRKIVSVVVVCLWFGACQGTTNLSPAPAPAFSRSQSAGLASPLAAQPEGIRSVAHVCAWDALDWDELYDAEKKAFEVLGWSRDNWNSRNGAASSSKDWSELTRNEKNAAQVLGYNAQNWEVSCPNDIPE